MNNRETAELGLTIFQKALNKNLIKTQKGEIHPEIQVYSDTPKGKPRFSYALMATGTRVKSFCVAIVGEPYKKKLCFDIGVSTFHKFRKQGNAETILMKAIEELKYGLSRNNITEFYIELKVDKENEASHKLCQKFADETIMSEKSTNYLKLIK
ncbi:hypothetical protein BS333_20865 (plasmid) [Vibrio azureus]|uniref:N-acetyltransferase domain-containing protein n=1 Tax=Vibrio azureus NBRC 104587 TaxID=1219077 RepID=U3A5L2_9VIBR|nr:hypothetical protein [Vibrio azureus]AUI88829.1 hypothetical protein BS333_20865 [Vibrio azureus]GAD75281.1 hypothetical protein VAZ01S_023_00480 [Vibrio azureus NBRC 104587]